jgi:hypothetical protein
MIYEQLQPIMKKFQRYIRLPAVVIFDRKSHIVSSHSRPKPEEFFKIISDAYIQAQNSGH